MTTEFSPVRGARDIVAEPSARPESIAADAVVVFLTEGGAGTGAIAAAISAGGPPRKTVTGSDCPRFSAS